MRASGEKRRDILINYQLLDEVEQNIVICRGRADQLLVADVEGRGNKHLMCEPPTNRKIV
jgi:hypothetical protein